MNPGTDDIHGLSASDLAAILRRRKSLALTTFLLVSGAVAAGTFLPPKQYKTRMKVLVKNERTDLVVSPDGNTG